jgi:pyruvate dehydrogenase kinase 2/3/4
MTTHARRALVPSTLRGIRPRAFSVLGQRPTPAADIAEYAGKRQTGVNMQALLSTGMGLRLDKSTIDASLPTQQRTLIQVAQFLHHELPIRLAHRAIELEELPHGLSGMPSVQTVRDWYVESFNDLISMGPPSSPAEEAAFEQVLHKIYDRHAPTLLKMARGVHEFKLELKRRHGEDVTAPGKGRKAQIWDYPEVHQFLDAFYVSRIGIRILIGQYLELHHPQEVSACGRRAGVRRWRGGRWGAGQEQGRTGVGRQRQSQRERRAAGRPSVR